MTISGYNDILKTSLDFLRDDYTELWVIARNIQDLNQEFNASQILDATKIVTADLVTNYNAVLVDTDTERPLNKLTGETIEIVNKHLDQLGKVPNIGDGLWLTIE